MCREEEKFMICCKILKENQVKTIVFVETKKGVDLLYDALKGEGMSN